MSHHLVLMVSMQRIRLQLPKKYWTGILPRVYRVVPIWKQLLSKGSRIQQGYQVTFIISAGISISLKYCLVWVREPVVAELGEYDKTAILAEDFLEYRLDLSSLTYLKWSAVYPFSVSVWILLIWPPTGFINRWSEEVTISVLPILSANQSLISSANTIASAFFRVRIQSEE